MSDLVGTPAQVARKLEITEKALRELKGSGRGFPFVKISEQRWVVPWAALDRWLAEEAARAGTLEAAIFRHPASGGHQ
jgi:hypothetical protein